MATLSDAKFQALRDQGFTGAMSDMTLQWLQDNGATSNHISDAWAEMLSIYSGNPVVQRTDDWYALLGVLGYTGAMNDRELAFWVDGGIIGIVTEGIMLVGEDTFGFFGYLEGNYGALDPERIIAFNADMMEVRAAPFTGSMAIILDGGVGQAGVSEITYELFGGGVVVLGWIPGPNLYGGTNQVLADYIEASLGDSVDGLYTFVPVPPVIDVQPQNLLRNTAIDNDATFTITASDATPSGVTGYQWFEDAVLMPGENAAALTVPLAPGDPGSNFYCVVSNSGPIDIQSATALLTTTELYDPLDDHPDWQVLQGLDANIALWQDGVVVTTTTGPGGAGIAYEFDSLNARDVRVGYTQLNKRGGTAFSSFSLCARLQDNDNFVGVRYYQSALSLNQRVNGALSTLVTWGGAFQVGDFVEIEAVGAGLRVYVNGVEVMSAQTQQVGAGGCGIVYRGNEMGIDVGEDYQYEEVDNLYVNPELAGGALSNPTDQFPPTAHHFDLFTQGTAEPLAQVTGFFHWWSNRTNSFCRQPLRYDLVANHPGLAPGVYDISYDVLNTGTDNQSIVFIGPFSDNMVTVDYNRNMGVPGSTTRVGSILTVTGPLGGAAQQSMSVGGGAGQNNRHGMEIFNPRLIRIGDVP